MFLGFFKVWLNETALKLSIFDWRCVSTEIILFGKKKKKIGKQADGKSFVLGHPYFMLAIHKNVKYLYQANMQALQT